MDENSTLQEDIKNELLQTDEKIAELEAQVQMAEDIHALHEDERFQRVVLDGYLGEESERIFALLTTPMGWKREINENLMDKLGSIRDLKEYFGVKLKEAVLAPEQIDEQREYRKSVTARGGNIVDMKE